MNDVPSKSLRLRSNTLLLAVVGLSWGSVYEETFGDVPFGVFAGGCLLALLVGKWRLGQFQVLGHRPEERMWEYLRHAWLAVVLSWGYGFAMGWYLENPPGNIVRNFFGLTLYAFAPLFLCARISARQAIKLVTAEDVAAFVRNEAVLQNACTGKPAALFRILMRISMASRRLHRLV